MKEAVKSERDAMLWSKALQFPSRRPTRFRMLRSQATGSEVVQGVNARLPRNDFYGAEVHASVCRLGLRLVKGRCLSISKRLLDMMLLSSVSRRTEVTFYRYQHCGRAAVVRPYYMRYGWHFERRAAS